MVGLSFTAIVNATPAQGNLWQGIRDFEKGQQEMGWLTGLEPATTGITILDSTN